MTKYHHKQGYLNRPQIYSAMVNAFEEYHVDGRGSGKTEGKLARRAFNNASQMPGGLTALVTPSYNKLLEDTLPGLIRGMSYFGLKEGIHYFAQGYAPSHFKWPKPTNAPREGKSVLHFKTGHVTQFVSLNIKSAGAGPSYDGILADEFKHLNMAKYEGQLLQANRGQRHKFSHTHLHHGICATTDMPSPDNGFIFAKEDEMDKDLIRLIYHFQRKIEDIRLKLYDEKKVYTIGTIKQFHKQIAEYEETLFTLRNGHDDANLEHSRMPAIFYSESPVTENVNMLGRKYLRDAKRNLTDPIFQTSIMNRRIFRPEQGFYDEFNSEHHGRDPVDNGVLQELGLNYNHQVHDNCKRDGDHFQGKMLHLAPDYGGNFNCALVYHKDYNGIHFLKDFFVKPPEKIAALAKQIDDYYGCRRKKVITFHYDHTAVGEDPRDLTIAEEWEKQLRALKWTVILDYHGQAPRHHAKFLVLNKVLGEEEPDLPKVTYNNRHCPNLEVSLQLAGVKISKNKYEKDKTPETKSGIKQETATHFSDAFDTAVYFHVMERVKDYEPQLDLIA